MKKLTKEEKLKLKEEKKKIKQEQAEISKQINKMNKSTKIVLIAVLSFLGFLLINNFIMYYNESYSLFFITNIVNPINGVLFYISSVIPYSSFIFYIVFFILCIISIILEIVITNSKKSIEEKNKQMNRLNKTVYLGILLVFPYLIVNCYYLHLPTFDSIYFKDTVNKTYKVEDLVYLNEYLKDKVLLYASELEREDGNVVYDKDINKTVIEDLHNLSKEFPILKGLYPPKSSNLTNGLKGYVGSQTYGLTHFYSTYFDYDMDKSIIFNTIAHEYTHTKGITRENETVFISSLAGMKSKEKVSNYAGYLEAFSRVNYALFDIDPNKANDIEDGVVSLCLSSSYNELCELYTKNNGDYIIGAKKLLIKSYYLKNYVGHEKELRESLEKLSTIDYKITIDNKEVTIDEVIKSINEDNNTYFVYAADINKDKYNKVKDAIKDKKLYLAIYQQNKIIEDSKDKENPEEFYLAPYKDYDSLFVNGRVASIDYTYERSARLFLEYFESEGYK